MDVVLSFVTRKVLHSLHFWPISHVMFRVDNTCKVVTFGGLSDGYHVETWLEMYLCNDKPVFG